jgi:hypothetical protein
MNSYKTVIPFGWTNQTLAAASIVLGLLTLTARTAWSDSFAFNIGSNGTFGTLDLTTGALSQTENSGITPAGLGEIGSTLFTAASEGAGLYSANTVTGDLTQISSLGLNGAGFNSLGSTTTGLYALDNSFNLYSINPTTGAANFNGPTGAATGALPGSYGFSLSTGSSTLYFEDGFDLYSLNTTTGSGTLIGQSGAPGIGFNSLVSENGTLYGVNSSDILPYNTLYMINTSTGVGTLDTSLNPDVAVASWGLAPAFAVPEPDERMLFILGFGFLIVTAPLVRAARRMLSTADGPATLGVTGFGSVVLVILAQPLKGWLQPRLQASPRMFRYRLFLDRKPRRFVAGVIFSYFLIGGAATFGAPLTVVPDNTVSAPGRTGGGTGMSAGVDMQGPIFTNLNGVMSVTQLLPLESLPVGGSSFFTTALNNWNSQNGNNYTFKAGTSGPENSLRVNSYQAIANKPHTNCAMPCAGIYSSENNRVVTNGFAVTYHGDFTNGANWIQAVKTNYDMNGNRISTPYLDNNNSTTSPFYSGFASTTALLDGPARALLGKNVVWRAYTYYVGTSMRVGGTGVVPGGPVPAADPTTEMIYNGVEWGFATLGVQTSNVGVFIATIDNDLSSTAALDAALGGFDTSDILTQADLDTMKSEFDSTVSSGMSQVPEAEEWELLVTGLGFVAILKWRFGGRLLSNRG